MWGKYGTKIFKWSTKHLPGFYYKTGFEFASMMGGGTGLATKCTSPLSYHASVVCIFNYCAALY